MAETAQTMMNAHLLKQTSVTLIPYAPILTAPMFAAASEDTWAMVLVVQILMNVKDLKQTSATLTLYVTTLMGHMSVDVSKVLKGMAETAQLL